MKSPILYAKEGCLSFPKLVAEFYLYPGDKVALIGSNGSGKSTLLKLLAGTYALDSGEFFIAPGTKVAYLQQDINFSTNQTAIEFVKETASCKEHIAENYLRQLNIESSDVIKELSGGQKRRALLASVLSQEAKVYLLDEPTNHLDIAGIEWLESWVKASRSCFVIVSHDRKFLLETSKKTWWLSKSKLYKLDHGFQEFDSWQEGILAEEAKQTKRLSRKLETETLWLHQGVTARRRRNQGRLQKLYELRQKVKDAIAPKLSTEIKAAKEASKAKFILEAENVSLKANGKLLIKEFSYRILRGERIGIIGPNGSGKTTLLRVLIGDFSPSSGIVKRGEGLQISYFMQDTGTIDKGISISSFLQPSGNQHIKVGGKLVHIGAHMKKFGLDPSTLQEPLATLSGGQLNRLRLAKVLSQESNLLVLDEPTNDLDMEASDALLDALSDYGGTVLAVSHDRDFLDQFATRTISISKSTIESNIGGYQPKKESKPCQTNKLIKKPLPRNLPYNLKRRLEMLPGEVSCLEKEIAEVKVRLEMPELYNKENREELAALSNKLKENETRLEEKLHEWIEIENIRDELKTH